MPSTAVALARSTHPGPVLAITVIAIVLAIGVGLDPWRVALLGFAILANQASVGLSNDWIDADRDRAVGRTDKPVALGLLEATTARNAAVVAATLAVGLMIPLGWAATLAQAAFVGAAWAYNAGLKSTPASIVPYLVGFGLLPIIVTLCLVPPRLASPWAVLAGALLGAAAHFANVLPDLEADRATGVRGLPHRVGKRTSGLVIAVALAGASASIVLGPGPAAAYAYAGLAASVLLAISTAVLVLRGVATRLVFRLIILAALIDVVLLALSGSRLLAG